MKVRLLTGRVGEGFTQEAGQIIDVSDREGHRMIASQQAEPVGPQRATAGPSESAQLHGQHSKR